MISGIIAIILPIYLICSVVYKLTKGSTKMNYKLALQNLMRMAEIALVSTFTAIYIMASFVLLLCAIAIDITGNLKDAKHSITIGLGKYEYIFSTKK
ncbi:hypothetical protein LCGC14_1451130 [marine sediment metagenome]|uniref:Uncharacterized protein n=1 Tax=marine sediment metagenome TaxID=412755 RepID=A0A0F9LYI9_9ZZZZ